MASYRKSTMQPSTPSPTRKVPASPLRIPARIGFAFGSYYACLIATCSSMGRLGYFSPGGITLGAGCLMAGVVMYFLNRKNIVSFPLFLIIMIATGQALIATSAYYVIDPF